MITEQRIKERAYYIWLKWSKLGFRNADDADRNWFHAKRELEFEDSCWRENSSLSLRSSYDRYQRKESR